MGLICGICIYIYHSRWLKQGYWPVFDPPSLPFSTYKYIIDIYIQIWCWCLEYCQQKSIWWFKCLISPINNGTSIFSDNQSWQLSQLSVVVFGYLAAAIHRKDLQGAFAAFAKAYYLRDAYTGWVLLRMVPSRLPSRNFSACSILAAVAWTFDSFPVRSWRSRSRGREKNQNLRLHLPEQWKGTKAAKLYGLKHDLPSGYLT